MNNQNSTPDKTLKDTLTLSPIEKYIIYGTFPWKMLLHILLILLTTWQVMVLVNSTNTSHNRNQLRVFKKIFTDSSEEIFNKAYNTPQDMQQHFNQMINVADYSNAEFSIRSYYNDYGHLTNASYNAFYKTKNISEPILVPFNASDAISLKNFMYGTYQLVFAANNIETFVSENRSNSPCIAWNMSVTYDFRSYSKVEATFDAKPSFCNDNKWLSRDSLQEYHTNSPIVHLTVLGLAITTLILNFRYFHRIGEVYMNARYKYQKFLDKRKRALSVNTHNLTKRELDERAFGKGMDRAFYRMIMEDERDWADIPFYMKLKLMDPWHSFSTVGSVIQLLASALILADELRFVQIQYTKTQFVLVGIGNWFSWFQILCYLEYNQEITLITTTLAKALKLTLTFFGICLPLLIGFAILGQAWFWKYSEFSSTSRAMQKLFALTGGDIVYDSFTGLHDEGMFKQLYLFAYMILFFTALQNIFVAVIMEGYEMSLIRKAIDNNNPFPEKSSAERAAIQDRKTRIRDGYESDSSESQQTKLTSSSNVGTISPNSPPQRNFGVKGTNQALNSSPMGEIELSKESKLARDNPLSENSWRQNANNPESQFGLKTSDSPERQERKSSNASWRDFFNASVVSESSLSMQLLPGDVEQATTANGEETIEQQLRLLSMEIMNKTKIMYEEAVNIPETSVLSAKERKYLKGALVKKLDAVSSKIDYIIQLSSFTKSSFQ